MKSAGLSTQEGFGFEDGEGALDGRFLVEPAFFGFEKNAAAERGEECAGRGGLGICGVKEIEESGRLLGAYGEDTEAVTMFEVDSGPNYPPTFPASTSNMV
ncbi:MAG TPA: hypothetical protein VNH19_22170, partial [Candidatus Limnocylindrales bacterium]|nr:hypothetical protein [Candidatus Limnocylindrales bacterium]